MVIINRRTHNQPQRHSLPHHLRTNTVPMLNLQISHIVDVRITQYLRYFTDIYIYGFGEECGIAISLSYTTIRRKWSVAFRRKKVLGDSTIIQCFPFLNPGWYQHNSQPIKGHVRKSLHTTAEVNIQFPQQPMPIGQLLHRVMVTCLLRQRSSAVVFSHYGTYIYIIAACIHNSRISKFKTAFIVLVF